MCHPATLVCTTCRLRCISPHWAHTALLLLLLYYIISLFSCAVLCIPNGSVTFVNFSVKSQGAVGKVNVNMGLSALLFGCFFFFLSMTQWSSISVSVASALCPGCTCMSGRRNHRNLDVLSAPSQYLCPLHPGPFQPRYRAGSQMDFLALPRRALSPQPLTPDLWPPPSQERWSGATMLTDAAGCKELTLHLRRLNRKSRLFRFTSFSFID